MPKTRPLTRAQREAEKNETRRRAIADNLTLYMKKHALNREGLGSILDIRRNTVTKILSGEEVTLPTDKFFRLLEVCGCSVKMKVNMPTELLDEEDKKVPA